MQGEYSTSIEVNKVGIEFTTKKITAYGGFSLLALFFEKIIPTICSSETFIGIHNDTETVQEDKESEEMSEWLWGYLSKLIPCK